MAATIDYHEMEQQGRTSNSLVEPPRILCIDDDPEIHVNIELRLRAYEVVVEHAYYGMQGIAESLHTGPDLIVTDMAMPNGDGSYLIEVIRRNPTTSSVPVIVLTGMRDKALKCRVLRDGADVFLQKPISFAELLDAMRRFVDFRERRDEERP